MQIAGAASVREGTFSHGELGPSACSSIFAAPNTRKIVCLLLVVGMAPLFEEFVRSYNIPFGPLDDEYIRLVDTPEGREALENGSASLSLIRKVKPMTRRMLDDIVEAAEGADLIVYRPKALAGSHLGEKWGRP